MMTTELPSAEGELFTITHHHADGIRIEYFCADHLIQPEYLGNDDEDGTTKWFCRSKYPHMIYTAS